MSSLSICDRRIDADNPPLVIAEIGINHEGSLEKAMAMVDSAAEAGCECVKFQCHVVDDEMAPAAKDVIPGNATESIYDIMARCAFDEEQDQALMKRCEGLGLIYLSTPFSRAAADRLERMGVAAYKIGSGECNNTPLIKHISSFGKPVILSTGMNDLESIKKAVAVLERSRVQYAVLHCTSIYPTPYEKVRLGALLQLREAFDCPVGLSDHSIGIWTCLGAVALGAAIVEKHFTVSKDWPGPDIPISIDAEELRALVVGTRAIWLARGGEKEILEDEAPTIAFAYASVCSIADIPRGEKMTRENIWVKRPGTGEIMAVDYDRVLGKRAARNITSGELLKWSDLT